MSSDNERNNCGCCGYAPPRPTLFNRPGRSTLDYRIGVYGSFFRRMIDRLGREEIPDGRHKGKRPLLDLTTRAPDDFSTGLIDAWAMVGDILSFYQERIANEGFIRTAIERRSILELARAIGYELNPGVAADTYLAFTVDESDTTPNEIEIPAGTQVQSLPQKQDELPQTFETGQAFTARPAWNVFVPRQTVPQSISSGTNQLVFEGIQTHLRAGDRLLVIGTEKEAEKNSDLWDVRRVVNVDSDPVLDQTTVTMATSSKTTYPAAPRVYAFREQASIFGHNAADWPALSNQIKADYLGHGDPLLVTEEEKKEWPRFTIFAPGSVVRDRADITKIVAPTARKVVDAAVAAGEKQAKFLTRSAITSAPSAAFSAISVLEALTRELVKLTLGTGADGTQTLLDLAAGDSPIATITESIQKIITNLSFAPPDTAGVGIDQHTVFTSPGAGIDLNEFFGNIENLKPRELVDNINVALRQVLQLPFSIGFVDPSLVGDEIGNVKSALNDLWQLNPTLRIFNAFNQVLTATGETVGRAAKTAARSFHQAAGAGAASAISGILEMVLESAMQFDPEPDDIVRLVRFTTKVANYAAALPTAAMLDANDAVRFSLDASSQLSSGDILEGLQDSEAPILGELDVPPEMKNLTDAENRKAFYTALGALGVGAAGAGLAFGAAAGTSGLAFASPLLAAGFGPALMPLMGIGIAPLLATAPGFGSGIDDIYAVANRAAEKAATPVTKTLGVKRGFAERIADTIDLDTRYTDIVPETWLYFETAANRDLFHVHTVADSSRSEYMISAKVTRLSLDGPNLSSFSDAVRELTVYAAPEELTLTRVLLADDVTGTSLVVDGELPTMSPGQMLLVSGIPIDENETAAEAVRVKRFEQTLGSTEITLENGLTRSYVRKTVEIFGNIVAASHGETVAGEVLGHGSGASPHQHFPLKRRPLTYTAANTVSGSQSSLVVQVDEVAWTQVPSLYQQEAGANVYAVRIANDAQASIQFGDGQMGARLPTGLENVTATYRNGIGLPGEVSAGTLTLLKTKPYGVKRVINPMAADGADDPERLENARENAPVTVRTLDRIVSRWDYEDFAATFAGIGKAMAVPIWDGTRELVHITVADPTGNAVGGEKIALLISAMDTVRDPLREVLVENYTAKTFSLAARVRYDAAYAWEAIKIALEAVLTETFSFAQRQFGQAVSVAHILTVMHSVEGVIAVDVNELYIDNAGADHTLNSILDAGMATFDRHATGNPLADRITPAGLLTINADSIELKEKAL